MVLILLYHLTAYPAWFSFWPFISARQRCGLDLKSAALEFKKRHDIEVNMQVKASNEALLGELWKPNVSAYFTDSRPPIGLVGMSRDTSPKLITWGAPSREPGIFSTHAMVSAVKKFY